MAVAVRWYYTVHIAQQSRCMAFIKATKRHHRASTRSDSINRTCLPLIFVAYLIVKCQKKGHKVKWMAPNNNRGLTYQADEKHLTHLLEYFFGIT